MIGPHPLLFLCRMPDRPTPLPPAFIRLAWSNLATQSTDQVTMAAVPIVAVLALGAGPGTIGLLATAQSLPFLLLAIPFGLWADRSARRRLMVGAELVRVAALLVLLLALLLGDLSIGLLAALGFIAAVGTVGFSVTAPALVPALVPQTALARANGRIELARSVAFAAGPALAGALVAWAGASMAFALSAALSVVAVLLLAGIDEPVRATVAPRHPWTELREGAVFVWGHALLRPILLTSVAWNIAWFVLQAAYVPYAARALGLSANAIGLTLACYGVGMVVGALAAPRVVAAMPFGRAILVGPAMSVLAMALIVATLVWPTVTMAALAFFTFGAGPILWTITSVTLRQTVTPSAMLGRVGSIFVTVSVGARPLGASLGALVGAQWGEAACLWLALAVFCVQFTVIMASPVRTLAKLPAAVG